jgi:CheY-like chemotaxis protein
LKTPKVDGLEGLRQIKGDARLRTIPVVMTSSREEQDVVASYDFVEAVRQVGAFWKLRNGAPPPRAGGEGT